jgi:hypothetical protein
MAARDPAERTEIAAQAAHTMWSGVANREERLANAHDKSPSGLIWHARRLFGQGVDLEALTDTHWKQAADARRAWLRANALKATRARRLKRAQRLRDEAEAIEAQLAAGDA